MRKRGLLIVGAILVQCAHIVVYMYCFENALHCCVVGWWLASWTWSVTTRRHSSVVQLEISNKTKNKLLLCMTGNTVLLFLNCRDQISSCTFTCSESVHDAGWTVSLRCCRLCNHGFKWVVMAMMPNLCLWHHDLSITILPRSLVTD